MNSIRESMIERRLRSQAFLVTLRAAGLVAALTLLSALPSHAYSWYTGASVGSDGTVYGWGVSDATTYSMYHVAYVSTALYSPKGRYNGYGMHSAQNSVREDVSLAFDPTDLGTYQVQSTNEGYCYSCSCWLFNCPTGASPLLRMTRFAALTSVDNSPDPVCNCARTTRSYRGVDIYGWTTSAEFWVLNESFTAKNSSCVNGPNIGGNNLENGQPTEGFIDVIETGCSNPGCVFQTNQTFSVAPNQYQGVTQVPGVECIGMTSTQCYNAAATGGGSHTGWHTNVTNSSVTVTDN